MNGTKKAQIGVVIVFVIIFIIGSIWIFQPSEKQKALDALQIKMDQLQKDIDNRNITIEQANQRMAEYNAEFARIQAMP
jgi:Tfp pilus assembly protein PilO